MKTNEVGSDICVCEINAVRRARSGLTDSLASLVKVLKGSQFWKQGYCSITARLKGFGLSPETSEGIYFADPEVNKGQPNSALGRFVYLTKLFNRIYGVLQNGSNKEEEGWNLGDCFGVQRPRYECVTLLVVFKIFRRLRES